MQQTPDYHTDFPAMNFTPLIVVGIIIAVGAFITFIFVIIFCLSIIKQARHPGHNSLMWRSNEERRIAEIRQTVPQYYPPPVATNAGQSSSDNNLMQLISSHNQPQQYNFPLSQPMLQYSSQNQLLQPTLSEDQRRQQFVARSQHVQYYSQQPQSMQEIQHPVTTSQFHHTPTALEISNLEDIPPQYENLFPPK